METRRFERTEGQMVMFDPSERLSWVLQTFDAFRGAVREGLPDLVEAFEASLHTAVTSSCEGDHDLPEIGTLPSLSDPLSRAYARYALESAGYPTDLKGSSTRLPREDALKGTLWPAYRRYRALCDVWGREKAVPWIKGYIDRRIRGTAKPDLSLEDVDGYWRELTEVELPTSGVAARFSRGKNAFRIDSCMWHDVTRPLNDPEISFLVCCYGDTAGMHALHPSFSYTCASTLVQGDPYCSKCTIDRRHVDSIEPPDRAFFEALGSVERGHPDLTRH